MVNKWRFVLIRLQSQYLSEYPELYGLKTSHLYTAI